MQTILRILLLAFLTQIAIAQQDISVPWKHNNDIRGQFDMITKQGSTLYGYNASDIYTSTDYGDNWSLCSSNPKIQQKIITGRDSLVFTIYNELYEANLFQGLGSIKSKYHIYKNTGCINEKVGDLSFFNMPNFHGGSMNGNEMDEIKILSDSTIIYQTKKYNNSTQWFGMYTGSSVGHFVWEKENEQKKILIWDITRLNSSGPYQAYFHHQNRTKLHNIVSHTNHNFVCIRADSTFLLDENTLNTNQKTINPFHATYYTKIHGYGSKLFVLLEDGTTYRTTDLGSSWTSGMLNITTPIISYKYNHGTHIIQTKTNTFISQDFINFTSFQTTYPNFPSPTDFFIFGDVILANSVDATIMYRSFDKGISWQVIHPKNIPATYISSIVNTDSDLFIIASGNTYRQICRDSFLLDTNFSKLADIKNNIVVTKSHSVIRQNGNIIELYNYNTNSWQPIKAYSEKVFSIQKLGDNIAIFLNEKAEVIDNQGTTIKNISIPDHSNRLYYSQDTAIVLYNDAGLTTCKQTIDGGMTWTYINIGYPRDIYLFNNKFYLLSANQLLIYSDITSTPDTIPFLFNEDAQIASLSVQNGALFLINQSNTENQILRINSDGTLDKITGIPRLLKDQHDAINSLIFYIDTTSDMLLSILGNSGLYTSKYSYQDSNIVNTLPSTTYSSCYGKELTLNDHLYLESGDYIQPGSSCTDDQILNISYFYENDTLLSGTLCANDYSISFLNDRITYNAPGQYQVIFDGDDGACDTLVEIEILGSTPIIWDTLIFSSNLCHGDSVTYMGQSYFYPTNFIDTISSVSNGCDSIIQIIVINYEPSPIKVYQDTLANCEGAYVLFNGKFYEAPGVYPTDTILSSLGCDSIINMLIIGINPDNNNCISSGNVFFDENKNGIQDGEEQGMSNISLVLNTDSITIFSHNYGKYFWYSTDTLSTISIKILDTSWNITTDSVQYLHPLPSSDTTHYFGLYPKNKIHEGLINLSSDQTRCNTSVQFYLLAKNIGSYTETGSIVITYDAQVSFNSADILPDLIDTAIHQLTWFYGNAHPYSEIKNSILFQMPDASQTDSTLTFTTQMFGDSSGTNILLDQYQYTPTVLCSFDPNDKLVMPSGQNASHYTLHDKKLTYTVRFQNTGNADAINITVRDTIDNDLDISTFSILNSSFPVQTTIQGQAIEFLFRHINLADSTHNEPKSHGFVTYEIKPHAGLGDYTEIKNTAHIYFDFNDAVITNTLTNTMVSVIPVSLSELEQTEIAIRPNPADNIIYISAADNHPISQVIIYNSLGEIVLAQKQTIIDVSHLPQGIYLVKVKIGDKFGLKNLVID